MLLTNEVPSVVVRELYFRGEPRRSRPLIIEQHALNGKLRVELTASDERVTCVYERWHNLELQEEGEFEIPISSTRPNYGGRRLWLHCPSCGRRAGRLFLVDEFLCRVCAGVTYPCQLERKTETQKRLERALAIRDRLGSELLIRLPVPKRPRGMHRATYSRLTLELEAIEADDRVLAEAIRREAYASADGRLGAALLQKLQG